MINILLVDNHDLVRAGIRKILDDASGIKVIGEAATGEDAVKLARKLRPNVVVTEIKMPGIGGIEATRKIRRIDSDIRVLALTTCDNDLYPTRLLQAGASGYLTKATSSEEMIRAIRTIHSGQRYIMPDIANRLALRHVTNKDASPFEMLSERELQVLMMITRGSNAQTIAESLHLSAKTVNSHRYRIFSKLKVKNDVSLTLLAIRYGLTDSDA